MIETENCVSLRINHRNAHRNALNLRREHISTISEKMAYLHVIQRRRRFILQRDRVFLNRLTLNDINDEELTKVYRLDRNMLYGRLDDADDDLLRRT